MELIRQPIFLLLMTASVFFEIFLAVPYYFAFGDEPKLVENSVLAVMLLSGLLGAVLSASASLAREIQRGTVLAVLSKPVGRGQFFLAKYAGIAAALTVLMYVNLVGVLLASRMAFDAYGSTDIAALVIFGTGVAMAYGLAGFSNFFLRRPFVSDAVLALVIFATLAVFVIFRFTTQMESVNEVAHVDWRLVPAGILILFAAWIFAAMALACSTRLDTIPTLAICSAFFLIGLASDYTFGRHMEPIWQSQPVWLSDMRDELNSSHWSENQKVLLKQIIEKYDANRNGKLEANELLSISAGDKSQLTRAGMGGSWWASVLYTVIPNWQYFWLADALDMGKSTFQWGYVGKVFAYMVAYAGAVLAIGMVLFEDRELS